jgi:hypothetical protein
VPKGKPVGNFAGFLTQVVASFSRFHKSGSISIAAEFQNPFELRSASEMRIELPSRDAYAALRAKWKQQDYKNIPLKGICMHDDELGSYNSLVTIKFVCKPLAVGEPPPYQAQLAEAILCDANRQPYGYVSEFSYSFYPDLQSKRAKEIGYVRYDFHPDIMGDGDTGGHPYFHFHGGSSGEELEEVELDVELRKTSARQSKRVLDAQIEKVRREVRFPTGLTMPEAFISTLEYKLAPNLRQKRIERALAELNWYYLMLDLTPQALKERLIKKYGKAEWNRLLQSDACQASLRKAEWHSDLFGSQ